MPEKPISKKMSLTAAISMAVGTMIGASIFSIFGLGAEIAKQNLPFAFLLSAFYAMIVAYSYARMGSAIRSNAGPIAFILKGIGDNIVTGALSILIWMINVVSIALFLQGFAGYFLPLLNFDPTNRLSLAIVAGIVIVIFTALNFFGSKAVGKVEIFIVLIKLSILVVFIIAGLTTLNVGNLKPSADSSAISGTLHASVIFFLSYMGFGLITNASENIKNSKKNVPRAIYLSIIIVSIVYIMVAITAIGNLQIPDLIKAQENALAAAAKPVLGNFGYLLISIGALFSISSALNATIYGGANIAYSLAKDGELPEFFERKVWFKSTEGLYITAGLALVFAIVFNIGEIASITSSIFIIIYFFVLISHFRRAKEYRGNRIILGINITILSAIFVASMYYQFTTQRVAFYGTIITLFVALVIEYLLRRFTVREFKVIEKTIEKDVKAVEKDVEKDVKAVEEDVKTIVEKL